MSKNRTMSEETRRQTATRLDGLLGGSPPGENASDADRERYAEGVFDREQHNLPFVPDEPIQGILFSDETPT